VAEFLEDILNMSHNDRALVYCISRRTVTSRQLHYGVNEFLWVFIKHLIMSYLIHFLVEILLILTRMNFGSTDQATNDSPFRLMWVVGLEEQIKTCMSRFSVQFCGQFRTHLRDQGVRERKIIISLNFHYEFDGKSKAVEVVKKLLKYCWPQKCRRI
jgi:hypothetical protein